MCIHQHKLILLKYTRLPFKQTKTHTHFEAEINWLSFKPFPVTFMKWHAKLHFLPTWTLYAIYSGNFRWVFGQSLQFRWTQWNDIRDHTWTQTHINDTISKCAGSRPVVLKIPPTNFPTRPVSDATKSKPLYRCTMNIIIHSNTNKQHWNHSDSLASSLWIIQYFPSALLTFVFWMSCWVKKSQEKILHKFKTSYNGCWSTSPTTFLYACKLIKVH